MTRTQTIGSGVDEGTLHVVATPIGNLGDLSGRACEVLTSVELICCEDTRRTGRLLAHIGGQRARLAVCNEHTETDRIDEVLAILDDRGQVALVSDAGTPAISDPGYRLVQAVIDAGHRVSAIPGPNAAIAALVISGLAPDRFVFEGFLPRRGAERTRRLAEIATEARTTIIYESPQRVRRTLDDLSAICSPQRRVVVARELTKLHEEVIRGELGTIDVGEGRGEYVIVLEGAQPPDPPGDDEVRRCIEHAIAGGASTRDAAQSAAHLLGISRRDAYATAVAVSQTRRARAAPGRRPTLTAGDIDAETSPDETNDTGGDGDE
jgi:16S rRNA (cytidine1402-2'-O)-methyltransferase